MLESMTGEGGLAVATLPVRAGTTPFLGLGVEETCV